MAMNEPLHLSDDEIETIRDEAARFRRLSPEARIRFLSELFQEYRQFLANPSFSYVAAALAEEEELGRRAVMEFVARHGENVDGIAR